MTNAVATRRARVIVIGALLALAMLGSACSDAQKPTHRTASSSLTMDAGTSAPDDFSSAPVGNAGSVAAPVDDVNVSPSCKATEDVETFELPVCELRAAPGSFEPKLQWAVELGNGFGPPLVANLTDDNGDGAIDLCDTPDVVVVAGFEPPDFTKGELFPKGANIHVLDGATGKEHFAIATSVTPQVTPAIGDVSGDGIPDIVAVKYAPDGLADGKLSGLMAFDHEGAMLWEAPLDLFSIIDQQGSFGVSLHDLEGDGTVEILLGTAVFEGKTGALRWNAWDANLSLSSIAVDLDRDGTLEVLTGVQALDTKGNVIWQRRDLIEGNGLFADIANLIGVYPMALNLDADDFPEVVIAAGPGLIVLEHDGADKLDANGQPLVMKTAAMQGFDLGDFNPPTAHDFDGDGRVDIGLGARTGFTVVDSSLAAVFKYTQIDEGLTASTAFDFLGDGAAEAIYADKDNLVVFDVVAQKVVMTWPHSGQLDYPVVVDVDNDGSAEIVTVSGGVVDTAAGLFPAWREKSAPTVQVLSDAEDRWIPTRRIWNQASYRVTNVLEDGRIPAQEKPHYLAQNTFRTNVQYEAGGSCQPAGPD